MTALTACDTDFPPLPTEGFSIPPRWEGEHIMLVSAAPQWVEMDFAAVIASRKKLKHLFGPTDSWPPEGLDITANYADLAWHEKEFQARRSFAYHLLNHEANQCLGCLYIYPTASRDHDAEAYLWSHIELDTPLANLIESEVIDWVIHEWPFFKIAWPGRFIPFSVWVKAEVPNYYACCRDMGTSPLSLGINHT